MGRIRTVKPDLFKHEDLYELEAETGLPVRLAFIGLFTCCDKEGRFKWRPRSLKTEIMPYDDVDFSRVLDALATRGFVVRYASQGEDFGVIPTFRRHQVINNRESASELPSPPDDPLKSKENLTREARVNHASTTRHGLAQGEGKGREGKGSSSSAREPERDPRPATPQHRVIAADLLDRGKANLSPWERRFLEDLCGKASITPKMQATLDAIAAKIGLNVDAVMANWRHRLETARKLNQWDVKWGPIPGRIGCLVPDELLQPGDGNGWTEWRAAS